MRDKNLAQTSIFALADETRLKIFLKIVELSASAFLGDEPILAQNTAKHLAQIFQLAKSTVAHHIEILTKAELIFPIAKNRFIYLFPNYTKIKDFMDFLNSQILTYSENGEYILAAEVYLKNPINNLAEFCDYLIIYNCKNVQPVKDPSGLNKIYFKITGFNEPFYLLITINRIQIFCIKKNIPLVQNATSALVEALTRVY